jgi:hypothetical protein
MTSAAIGEGKFTKSASATSGWFESQGSQRFRVRKPGLDLRPAVTASTCRRKSAERRPILCEIAILAPLAGCKRQNAYVPPPSQVGVAQLPRQSVTPYLETTGNTVAYNQVDLVARVSDFLQEIRYKDGALAHRGDTLFVIEPAPTKPGSNRPRRRWRARRRWWCRAVPNTTAKHLWGAVTSPRSRPCSRGWRSATPTAPP